MRKLKRAIAHAKMMAQGVQHINRANKTDMKSGEICRRSYFAMNWRKYI